MHRRHHYEMDMCSGTLLPKIIRFTLPLVLTGVLQLLYNAADVVVVGQFAGEEALAAVGSTGSLINLIVNIFMGLGVGASVVIARAYGAGILRRCTGGSYGNSGGGHRWRAGGNRRHFCGPAIT